MPRDWRGTEHLQEDGFINLKFKERPRSLDFVVN